MTELEKLDPEKILATARRLRDRIDERFPGSGLSGAADQLIELASHAGRTCAELSRPNTRLRVVSYGVIAIVVVASVAAAMAAIHATDSRQGTSWVELVQAGEAAANDLVLLGAAIYFFISFETRLKRGKVVKALHRLRTLAHIIDAHQLTKTPEVIGHESERTASSPERTLTAFELARYLDYCSEMLSLTGKIAALYGDGFDDSDALEAVNEIEEITIGLQGKIWQKLILLHALTPADPGRGKSELALGVARRIERSGMDAPGCVAAPAEIDASTERIAREATTEPDAAATASGARADEPLAHAEEPACRAENEIIEPRPTENE